MISISPDERKRLRVAREELGLRQDVLAKRIGVSPATISNVESGRSRQVRRPVYAAIVRALKLESATEKDDKANEAAFRNLVEVVSDLTSEEIDDLIPIITRLRRNR